MEHGLIHLERPDWESVNPADLEVIRHLAIKNDAWNFKLTDRHLRELFDIVTTQSGKISAGIAHDFALTTADVLGYYSHSFKEISNTIVIAMTILTMRGLRCSSLIQHPNQRSPYLGKLVCGACPPLVACVFPLSNGWRDFWRAWITSSGHPPPG